MTGTPAMTTTTTAEPERYWPDLTQIPDGWRIVKLEWMQGRSKVTMLRGMDKRTVTTSGNHWQPSGAFQAALATIREIANAR